METDLFGQTAPPPASSFAKRQAVMHRRHGTADGKRCADCVHLIRTCNGRRSYYKCAWIPTGGQVMTVTMIVVCLAIGLIWIATRRRR